MAIVLSPHSNRPINEEGQPVCVKSPIFWCEICNLKLTTPTHALQHLTGHSHKAKVNVKNDVNIESNVNNVATRKRGLESNDLAKPVTVIQDPAPKKNKVQPVKAEVSDKLFCSDCDITLNSAITAEMHFKGKKHAGVVAAKQSWPLSSGKQHISPDEKSCDQNLTPDQKKKEKVIKGFCNDCNIALNSDEQGIQHYNGTRHKLNAGIISEPPDRWLANQRGRGRGGEGGAFRGDQRNSRGQVYGGGGLVLLDHGRVGHLHGGFDQQLIGFGEGNGGFMQAHGRGFIPELGRFAQGNGGIIKKKGDWSVRGRGLMRGGVNKDRIVRGVNSTFRGRVGRGQTKRGLDRGSKQGINGVTVPTRGGGRVIVAGQYKNGVSDEPATIPGAKNLLSDYFVNANPAKDSFQPHSAKVHDSSSSSHDSVMSLTTKNNFKPTPTPVSTEATSGNKDPVSVSLTNTTSSEGIKKNEKCMKATVPGGKGLLSGYFVNAGSKDHFKIDEKKATVPGGKGSLSDYFVPMGTKDHFKHDIRKRNNIHKTLDDGYHVYRYTMQRNDPRNFFEGMSPDYNNSPSKDFYGSTQHTEDNFGYPPSKEWNLPPQPKKYLGSSFVGSQKDVFSSVSAKGIYSSGHPLPPEDYFDSPTPPSPKHIYGGGGNYYSSDYGGSNGYSNSHGYRNESDCNEYQMNTDTTYDSYYV